MHSLHRSLWAHTVFLAAAISLACLSATPADARAVRGGTHQSISGAHARAPGGASAAANRGSPNRNAAANRPGVDRSATANRASNTNRSRDVNRNVNRDTNINRDIDVDVDNGWDHHPVAAGVAFGTAAAVTSAVVGSMIYSLPPSCVTVARGGASYYQCGGVWYEPQYSGSSVTYVVVNEP